MGNNGKIKKKGYDIVISISMGLIILNLSLSNAGIYDGRTSPPLLAGSMILMFFDIFLIYQKREVTKINLGKICLIFIMGILFFIYGILFFVPTYILYAFIFLFQMPLTLLAIDKEILSKMAYYFAQWSIIMYAIIIIVSFVCAPISEKQYCGIMGNPNLWGEFLIFSLISILYNFEKSKKNMIRGFALIMVGINIAEVVFSRSRTSMLAVVMILGCYVVYLLLNRKSLRKRVICMVVCCIITMPFTYMVLTSVAPVTSNALGIEFNEDGQTFGDAISDTKDRYLKGINDSGDFSSGRVDIWREYISRISFLGHAPDPIYIEGYSDSEDHSVAYAHNTFIQIGYQGGIITLVAYFMIFIIVSIYLIKKLVKKEINTDNFYYISYFVYGFIYMMLANPFGPYNSYAMIGYWMFVVPAVFIDKCNRLKIERGSVIEIIRAGILK